jgi:hypothetical protein
MFTLQRSPCNVHPATFTLQRSPRIDTRYMKGSCT